MINVAAGLARNVGVDLDRTSPARTIYASSGQDRKASCKSQYCWN